MMGYLFQSEIEMLLIVSKMVFLHKEGLRDIACGSYFVWHLHFKQAQPKMCHSPKVEDGVEN